MAEPGFHGSRVRLPAGAGRPLQVFVNGVEQREGEDFAVEGGEVVFARELVPARRTNLRFLARLMVAGRYTTEHTVDVVYHAAGRPQMAHALPLQPPADG